MFPTWKKVTYILDRSLTRLQIALVSVGNSIQSYLTLRYTSEVYSGPTPGAKSPATALSGRTFGTWTFLTSLVRLNAAYHINEPAFYNLAMWTFAVT
jgi:hypothetical protein